MKCIITNKFKKLALRGNIERINDPIRNPYLHSQPGNEGDRDGVSYRVRMGDEYGESASVGGSTARGKNYPRGIKRNEDLDIQRKRDIPTSTHMFIDNEESDKTMKGIGEGANDQRFTDYRDRLPSEAETFGQDPISIQNMNTFQNKMKRRSVYNSLFDRLRQKLKGTYNG